MYNYKENISYINETDIQFKCKLKHGNRKNQHNK